MKTVLMIAPYFVPRRRVGAMRPFRFAIHLKKFGWNPVILTLASPTDQLTPKEKELLGDIKIIQINTPFDRTESRGAKMKYTARKKKKSWPDFIAEWIDKQIPVDSWLILFFFSYFRILKIAKRISPDIIWSTGDPWSGLWLGEKLARNLEKPFVADFRDPWTFTDVNLRQRSEFSNDLDRKIESKIIERADRIVFTAYSTQNAYQEAYPLSQSKMSVIYNSFEKSLMDSESDWKVDFELNKLHLLFWGSFRRLSPASSIIHTIQKMSTKNIENLNKIRVHSFGDLNDQDFYKIDELDLKSIFVQHEVVLPEKALTVLNKADLLLVSTEQHRDKIIPAKLWDYLATSKPILSITSNPEIKSILDETGAGIQFSPDQPDEIAAYLNKCILDKLNGKAVKRTHSEKKTEAYQSVQTTEKLAALLDELIQHD